jgi:hypothetical protein
MVVVVVMVSRDSIKALEGELSQEEKEIRDCILEDRNCKNQSSNSN